MKSCPKISFVIPVYNRANLILDALNSLKAQTVTEWEAIVVDDHSTDNLEEVIRDYDERVRYLKLPDKLGKGVSSARNYGNLNAKAELIAILDSDDLAKPERAELALESYKENNWDFYCTLRDNINLITGITTIQKVPLEEWDSKVFKQGSFVGHSTVVYTKKAALEIPYNSALPALDDYDLISRFIVLGKKMFFSPEITTTYRVHGGERITTHVDRAYQEELLRTIRTSRGWNPEEPKK